MRTNTLCAVAFACAVLGTAAASDHDDGEAPVKALDLADHFAFSPDGGTSLALVMTVNPRSLPGRAYYLSANARYELHITRAAGRTAPAVPRDDVVVRFEASAPTPSGDQFITMTLVEDGVTRGTHIGRSTPIAASRIGSIVANNATVGGQTITYFVGQRADPSHFDVNRFFQVRTFLARRFFGGSGGAPDASAELAPNCEGDTFLEADADGDPANLWNPPSCAPDFARDHNVTAIVVRIPTTLLGGGAVFDTWSTVSVRE